MNGKLTSKQLRMIILLVIVIIVVVTFRFGLQPLNEKTAEFEKQTEEYNSRIMILDAKIKRKAEFEEVISTSEKKALDILSKYGPGNTNEKTIMTLVELEKSTKMSISSVTFGNDTSIYYTSKLPSKNNAGQAMYRQPITISYKVSYSGFKDAMDFINLNKERMTVESVTASFDSLSGQLTGTMVINLYAVYGGEKEYEAPSTGVLNFGTNNIFGTSNSPDVE